MEYDKQMVNFHKLAPLHGNVYVDIEVMEFFETVMEKSWNFVAKISWQP